MSRRRRILAVLVAALPWAVAVPGVGAQTPEPPRAPLLAATLTTCTTGLDAADRVAVFTGTMPARKAASMAVRFDLYERSGAVGPFRRLTVPNFGEWERSQRNVAGFQYDKRVQALQAPAAYRVTVRFRWYDANGQVIRRATRTTPVCEQPDLRPDLRITRVAVGGTRADGTRLYTVTVRNVGATATTVAFTTALTAGPVVLPEQSIGILDAGGASTLAFVGRACAAGARVVATVDSRGSIDEAVETDDVARRTCPA